VHADGTAASAVAAEDPFLSRLRYLSLKHQGTLLGDSPAALACLQEAAGLDREDASLWVSLSRTAGRIGYLGLAVSYARRALELSPGDVVVWEWLVYLLAAQGQWEAAGVALEALAVHEPSHPW
jgi:Flp pilus assembly protein TadD